MVGNSKDVNSSQKHVHPKLFQLLERHREALWREPARAVDSPALSKLDEMLSEGDRPIVLDSFCGTGMSSRILAERYPEAFIVGVDKSSKRLQKAEPLPANATLLHANCESIWRHLAKRGTKLARHCIFYPNPWPKAAHLSRRIHGHPAFVYLLELGGIIELRSNWQVYVEEFGSALFHLGVPASVRVVREQEIPISRFEHKYSASGQVLWRLQAQPAPSDDGETDAVEYDGSNA